MNSGARFVVCSLGGREDPWQLPASIDYPRTHIDGGERSLYELAVAIAALGHDVELRGEIHMRVLDALATAAGACPRVILDPRRPAAGDVVIVPEGLAEPTDYACLLLSPARAILILLGPPGLCGWPFTEGWHRRDALDVSPDEVARAEHFQAMRDAGFALWTNSGGIAARAQAAGVECTCIGTGWPAVPEGPPVKTIDVAALGHSRWASLATDVIARLEGTKDLIPQVSHEEVLRRIGASRILLWPSRLEGWARVQCEARAMGTVPVALSSNVYANGLDPGSGSLLVDSVDAMPAAVRSLLHDPDRLANLSRQARTVARRQVDWASYVTRVGAAIHNLLPAPAVKQAFSAMGEGLGRWHMLEVAAVRASAAQEVDRLSREIADLDRTLAEARSRLTEARSRLTEARSRLTEARSRLATVEGSRSWRLTAPLREVAGLFRRRGAT